MFLVEFLVLQLQVGDGEGFFQDERYPDATRWMSYFTPEELVDLFPGYEVLRARDGKAWLNYLFRKQLE